MTETHKGEWYRTGPEVRIPKTFLITSDDYRTVDIYGTFESNIGQRQYPCVAIDGDEIIRDAWLVLDDFYIRITDPEEIAMLALRLL